MTRFSVLVSAAVLAGAFACGTAMAAPTQEEQSKLVADEVIANNDMKALCQGGNDALKEAATKATRHLAFSGKISGDYHAIGEGSKPFLLKACEAK